MDIQSIFSIQAIFQSIVVGIIVFFIRNFLELNFPSLKTNIKFTGFGLPLLAILISCTLVLFSGLIPAYLVGGKLVDKIGYGIICGFCSGFLFSMLKSFLNKEVTKNE